MSLLSISVLWITPARSDLMAGKEVPSTAAYFIMVGGFDAVQTMLMGVRCIATEYLHAFYGHVVSIFNP